MIAWRDVFLGVIAMATLAIAVGQIAVMLAAGRMARRVEQLADQFERDVRPLFGHLNAIGRDASRAAALATAQVERADQLFGEVATRVEETLTGVQATIVGPLREVRAILSAIRVAIQAIREVRQNTRPRPGRGDDEDALFI